MFIRPAQVEEAVTAVRQHTFHQPTIGLVLDSGLSSLADVSVDADTIPFDQFPHFPVSTVTSHHARIIIGQLEGQKVFAFPI